MSPRKQQPLRHAIGARLRELRQAAGISSQEALAHQAGVHRTYVGRVERGESGITVDTLATILAAMSVSLSEFFATFDHLISARTPRKRE
jgi:transcriptional regulator with XRE-family HTH domain